MVSWLRYALACLYVQVMLLLIVLGVIHILHGDPPDWRQIWAYLVPIIAAIANKKDDKKK